VTIQATNSQPGLPSRRVMSADTMKIPDPIIDPTTTMVASNRPRPRLNSVSRVARVLSGLAAAIGAVLR